ncbi:glycoside hydrolase family 95 protein [Butyrivibrio sp. NC3005]|uniref:glycoside hydrolase family 95 protein n=1 Tax=Butyrivibrio sp. NC3005 TaxID=1280685 RepID=UPI0003F62609|nr:glycoside hydrolase family 95 protein [Butyrivibrio sp. NC3005]
MKMWYDKKADAWNEALPIGNGRLGGMVYGDALHECIKINEDSVWSGKHLDRINKDALESLPVVRKLISEGKIKEAEKRAIYSMVGVPDSQRSYQMAGEMYLNMDIDGDINDYRRDLCLDNGIASVGFTVNNVHFLRKTYCSFPDNVMVMHISNSENEPFSFDLCLGRNHNCTDEMCAKAADTVIFKVDGVRDGISFAMAANVKVKGGKMYSLGARVIAENVTQAWIFLDVETSFRHEKYEEVCLDRIYEASQKCEELLERHVKDFSNLFDRVKLSFRKKDESKEKLPVNMRLDAVKKGDDDLGLLEMYFQYGRYLLISSSRENTLPANLQGIWTDQMYPVWDSKFTININTEMNYWLAGCGNLEECELPLFDLMERLKENGKETAKRMYGCRGSVAHHNTDIYADSAPQDTCITSTIWVMGLAWLSTHIWEHYLYSGDEDFLRKHFDVMEQCVFFFYDFLIEKQDGTLVTSPSMSPENTYIMKDGTTGVLCESAVMDTEILTELFEDYINSCRVLGLDEEKIEKALKTKEKFPKLKIGRYGQLQEWMEDYEELEKGHRHISHLYGVYPGNSISYDKNGVYMEAAKKSLIRRLENGGGHTGWSRAWIICLWARFREGAKTYQNLKELLMTGTYNNLMDNHPLGPNFSVFQIDGNLGAAAGILEMIAYSRSDRLELLPAITKETESGSLEGMRLRSGGTLSMKWEKGEVTYCSIMPDKDCVLTVVVGGKEVKCELSKGIRKQICGV